MRRVTLLFQIWLDLTTLAWLQLSPPSPLEAQGTTTTDLISVHHRWQSPSGTDILTPPNARTQLQGNEIFIPRNKAQQHKQAKLQCLPQLGVNQRLLIFPQVLIHCWILSISLLQVQISYSSSWAYLLAYSTATVSPTTINKLYAAKHHNCPNNASVSSLVNTEAETSH